MAKRKSTVVDESTAANLSDNSLEPVEKPRTRKQTKKGQASKAQQKALSRPTTASKKNLKASTKGTPQASGPSTRKKAKKGSQNFVIYSGSHPNTLHFFLSPQPTTKLTMTAAMTTKIS